ncbi:MAG: ribosome maturation factor RimM [bacterium]|nr:ribosome maturation factor RimM [bacterium]
MNRLEVGKIINTHGLRGEVKAVTWTDYPEVFEEIEYVWVKKKTGDERLDIKNIKYQKNNIILQLEQITSIEEAEKYKNLILLADREQLPPLPDGMHYIVDLLGLDVYDEDKDEKIGIIADVFNTGANSVYEVKRDGKKNLLLPVIGECVKNIDIENNRVTVHVMEGLDD